jgi:hypothetical protein
MEPSAWELNDVGAEFTTYLGAKALHIDDKGGDATGQNIITVKDLIFANGTIEYDLAFTPGTRFTAVHFRRKEQMNSEHFYVRGIWANDPNVNTAIQYAAILKGVNLWDVSAAYQSNANLKAEGWNHIKLVVRDKQLLAYVNDMNTPALYVPQMDGDWASGALSFDGTCYLANLMVTPDATPGLAPGKGFDPLHNDARYLRNWQVTAPQALPFGREPLPADMPKDGASWAFVQAEHHGQVNLSRSFGQTAKGDRRIVWLKTTIVAAKALTRRLDFGFSDEAYVYLNGKPLYSGKNLFNTPGMMAPRGRMSIENVSFDLPLKEGSNEVMIGLTNFFFGWGLVARLEDGQGLKY